MRTIPNYRWLILRYSSRGDREKVCRQVRHTTSNGRRHYTGTERLVWITEIDGEEVRYYSEPEVGLWRRFSTWVMGQLPIEKHL